MQNKNHVVIWFLVVLAVVGILIFISKDSREDSLENESNSMENENKEESTQNAVSPIEGVKVTVLQAGSGEEAKAGDMVSVNYTGKFVDGTPFDSNILPEFRHVLPFEFSLGAGAVIRGWDIGVAGMKIGEKRILEIAPEYAYGANGYPPVIPPNATLIFEVELVNINK